MHFLKRRDSSYSRAMAQLETPIPLRVSNEKAYVWDVDGIYFVLS
jgi:hypothetical protein